MTTAADDKSLQIYARLAGFMYLFVMAAYMVPMGIISGMAVPDDFARTVHNIAASEQLYRIALSSVLIGSVATILLGGALYALLRSVAPNLALFALLWRTAEATLGGVHTVIQFTALENYTGAAGALSVGAREALHELIISGYGAGFYISVIYFSVGSTIFFYLLFKSRYIPRLLSVFGVLASVLAFMFGFAHLLFPDQASALGLGGWGLGGWAPIFLAELATGLWLLIAGANLRHWSSRA